MSDQIYSEEFVTLTEEQRRILDGDPDDDIKVETHNTPIWQEPDPDELEESEESDKKKKKDDGMITIVEHGEDLLPRSKKKMKRPPMNNKEELEAAKKRGEKLDPEEEDLIEEVIVPIEEDELEEISKEAGETRFPRPTTVVQAPVPVKRKAKTQVNFKGSFGSVRAKYLDVYTEGVYLILVEDEDAEFSYSPPESDDIINVTVGKEEYKALSPGISFDMKNQKIRTTVLLIVKGEAG